MIKDLEQKTTIDLLDTLEKTTLLGDENAFPYKHANISIKTFSYKDLTPIQFYYIKKNLKLLKKLKDEFIKQYNIDIFNLDGYLNFKTDKYDQKLTMTPPIIEVVDGKNLLIDGMHRVMLSKILGQDIKCVYIENIKPEYYHYALPNPNGWEDIKSFFFEVPKSFKTRNVRYDGDDYRKYRRVYKFEGENQIPRKHTLKNDSYFKDMLSKNR